MILASTCTKGIARTACLPIGLLAALFLFAAPARAATSVRLGAVTQLTGPQDLDLEGQMIYAINFSANDPLRSVRGITFTPDRQVIPGTTLVGPQQVSPWQTKPEFGSSADANQLEEICQDIRWANSDSSERLRATLAVNAGEEYKLQIIISGNTQEDRRWDIRVNGRDAVDEITSLGVSPGQSYSQNRATLYTYQFAVATASVVVEMGHLFGANDGGDRNPIWQALTLERVFIPPAPDDIVLGVNQFFAAQTEPIGAFRAVDGRFGAVHRFELVSGEGSADNAKFSISLENSLLPRPFDFSGLPPGTAFSIRIRATDTGDAARFLEKTFTVAIAAHHPPSAIRLEAASINSLAQPGAGISRLLADDPDSFDRARFSLAAGEGDRDNALFRIENSVLLLAQPLPPALSEARLRFRATDLAGLSTEAAFVLPIQAPRVRINEMVAGSAGGIPDEAQDLQEWIELHNPLPQSVDLTGAYLTDTPGDLKKWQFPRATIPPNGYLLILADGLDAPPPGSTNLHANFSLDSSGEELRLTLADGATVISELDAPEFFPGVAYGHGSDGRIGHLLKPTPGQANAAIYDFGRNGVAYSVPRGFYTNAFPLELTAAVAGSTIRYTIDGSRPTTTTGLIYSGPITITPSSATITRGTRIIRALAVNPRAAFAPVETQTYLYINGRAGPAVDGLVAQTHLLASITRHAVYGPQLDDAFAALPALSLLLPGGPSSTERAASLELIDPSGQEPGFQIDCGVESTGTTSLGSPKLSMSAKFRARYGASKLRYPVYARGSMAPEGAADEFKELRLRGHSHDTFYWLGTRENPPVPYGSPPVRRSGDAQLMRNLWMEEMQLLMGQPGKHGRQVHLFLNGAYHGIYHIQEHADEDFMASYYPGNSEDFHFTSAAIGGSQHSNGSSWAEPWSRLKASLGNLQQASRWIDLTNLCDYMVLSYYAGNDWDWSAQHNWSAAGPILPDRGGWKFFQQDSDISLQDVAADCTDQDVPDGIFNALMRLPDFRALFRDRAYRLLYRNGLLTPGPAAALYNARMNEIFTAIVAETARWQPGSSIAALPWDRDQEWVNEWNYLKNTFFPQRTAALINQFKLHAGWWPAAPPEFNRYEGTVAAGFELELSAPSGAIYYTTDGSDPRLPGGGINPAATRVGSGGGGTNTAVTLIPAGSVWRFLDNGTEPILSWRDRAYDDSLWRSGPAEIGYGDGNEATTANFVDTDPATAGAQKNITTYFRRKFDAPNFSTLRTVTLRVVRDDGAVVYLNEVEIWRSNMPEGAINSRTPAAAGVGGADEAQFFEVTLPVSQAYLRPTDNILAVEIHQQTPESSDISFDLELAAGGVSTNTTPGAGSLVIDRPTLVRARVHTGSDWSALADAYLAPDSIPAASAANLVISEINYQPASGAEDDADNEFVEFFNTSDRVLDLSDASIADAITFRFPRAALVSAGERIILAKDPALFHGRYGTNASPYYRAGIRVFGPYAGSLSNGGERLVLRGADGSELFACDYGTSGAWPGRPGGKGSTLELINPLLVPLSAAAKSAWLSAPVSWRPSSEYSGSPGAAGLGPDNRIVINEILPAPAAPEAEAIELISQAVTPVDLSGWFLSDTTANYRKYRFPDGTRLVPGGILVLRESDFNNAANPASLIPFSLSDNGEDLYLVEALTNGAPSLAATNSPLIRFVDHVEYPATPPGLTLGRWPDADGPFARLEAATLGASNAPPVTGYAAWAVTAFEPGTPAELTAPGANPDGDNYSNLAEYAFALAPQRPDAAPLITGGWQGPDRFTFTYRTRTRGPEISYLIETSPDLLRWSPAPDAEVLARTAYPDASTRITTRLNPANDARFQFVRVSAQIAP